MFDLIFTILFQWHMFSSFQRIHQLPPHNGDTCWGLEELYVRPVSVVQVCGNLTDARGFNCGKAVSVPNQCYIEKNLGMTA